MAQFKPSFRWLLFWMLVLFLEKNSAAQNTLFGVPPMHHFPKSTYKAGTQNWDLDQDSRGILYAANNEGLLRFDGSYWSCHPVTNRTVVRAVLVDSLGRIYVGAQSEFGFFAPAENGALKYHSLLELLPEQERNLEDVWDIVAFDGAIFFRTKEKILEYRQKSLRIIKPEGVLTGLFSTHQGLFIQQNFSEILRFEAGKFQSFSENPEIKSEVTAILPWAGDTLLFCTLKNGIFFQKNKELAPWKTPNDAQIRENRIYSATLLGGNLLALGTSLRGLLILDAQRRIFKQVYKKNGLQNNNILCTFADRSGNLWLGLDNGIDCVVMDSPFSSVIPDEDLQGTGYAAAVLNKNLYLGVSNGVYRSLWQPNSGQDPVFEKIKSLDGQIWSLSTIGESLLVGHHDGIFLLDGQQSRQLSTEPGGWTFILLSEGYLLAGHYAGLVLYKKSGNAWVFERKIEGIKESCRIMALDQDGAVWVAHPYRGLYRVEGVLDETKPVRVEYFGAKKGLPSNLNNFVFNIAGKAVFSTEKGIFRYKSQTKTFEPDLDFIHVFAESGQIRYLREDTERNIWFVAENEIGMLAIDDFGLKKEVVKRVFPELHQKLVGGFEFIFPINLENVFLGAENGFIHFNGQKASRRDSILDVVFHQITVSGVHDSLLFGGYAAVNPQEKIRPVELTFENSNVRFNFSATEYKNPSQVRFRTRLVGLDRAWSAWTDETEAKYTNLGAGEYVFEVQAKNNSGVESAPLRYAFRVLPPWYASKLAFLGYALGILGLFAWSLLRQRRHFENQKEQLTEQHQQFAEEQQRVVAQSQAALSAVQNEKLEAEIRFKNQELASATMHLVQKGEILVTIQENLNQILEHSTNPSVKKEIQQLLNLLNFDAKLDEDWQQFAYHFDQVHVDFLYRLREKHPQLSSSDCKLCAYLRMNLSTKEIAPLLNISVRGVEASRYRLRKKLGIPNDSNLVDFMMNV